MSILLSMHSFHHWGYSIQKGDFLYNSIIVVQERTFDVTIFFKDDFSLIWVIWAVEKWVNILVSWLLLQNGSRESWKLCVNLCLFKWLSPTHKLISSLIPQGLSTLNVLLGLCLMHLRICFLKALTDSKFWILLILFYTTTDG